MLVFIEVLRAIATLLVLNSHLKGVYPTDILSFGGGLGLALFYMISGYLLANIRDDSKFSKWYIKKILRLYVPLILFRTILVVIGNIQINSFIGFIKTFIFPASWFVASMVIFYVIYYMFVKNIYRRFGKKSIVAAWFFCGLCFIVLYITKSPVGLISLSDLKIASVFSVETLYIITQFVWFASMLVGLYIREFSFNLKKKKKNIFNLMSAFLSVILFLVIRIFENKSIDLEFLLPISYIGFAFSLFKYFMVLENQLKKMKDKIYFKVMETTSLCSLEIYIVQSVFINLFKEIVFPINAILIIFVTLLVSFVLHKLSDKLLKYKKKKCCYLGCEDCWKIR